jgi:hypothetical protein
LSISVFGPLRPGNFPAPPQFDAVTGSQLMFPYLTGALFLVLVLDRIVVAGTTISWVAH